MADILIKNALIFTMNEKREIIKDGAIAITDNKIEAVGKTQEITKEYKAETEIDAKNKLVIPGFIYTHSHANLCLSRGSQGVSSLMKKVKIRGAFFKGFLEGVFWPLLEDKYEKKYAYPSLLLTSLEMLKSGVTCYTEVSEGPPAIPGILEEEERAVEEVGIRALLSFETSDRIGAEWPWPSNLTDIGKLGMQENYNFVKAHQEGRVRGMFALHAPCTCSEELLLKTKELADKSGAVISIHLAQDSIENEWSWLKHGKDTIEYLKDIGFLDANILGVHNIYCTDKEIEVYTRSGAKMSYSPISKAQTGRQIPPIHEYIRRGITIGLGGDFTDDMFDIMKVTGCLVRSANRSFTAITDEKLLSMATIDGAKAIGLEKQIGSIEPDKFADLVVLDLDKPHFTPISPPGYVSALVDQANIEDIDTVIVDGRILLQHGKVISVDESKVLQIAQKAGEEFWRRIGLS